jgi:tRNA pseudouridine38-40 synthase
MRLALVVEYEGTGYSGFQYQTNAPSIQEELEKAIAQLTGEKLRVAGAGRTDAGVHARGQVVSFETAAHHTPETFLRALNHYLPDEIAVKAAYRTEEDFDPRRMALSRRYRYTIDRSATASPLTRRTAYHLSEELDIEEMRRAAKAFVGGHDFASFAGSLDRADASTCREIFEADVRQDGDIMTIDVEGNSFLPHQVRRMAGALVDVGRGSITRNDLRSMLERRSKDVTARSLPSQGLCLLSVTYKDFPPKTGTQNGYLH